MAYNTDQCLPQATRFHSLLPLLLYDVSSNLFASSWATLHIQPGLAWLSGQVNERWQPQPAMCGQFSSHHYSFSGRRRCRCCVDVCATLQSRLFSSSSLVIQCSHFFPSIHRSSTTFLVLHARFALMLLLYSVISALLCCCSFHSTKLLAELKVCICAPWSSKCE